MELILNALMIGITFPLAFLLARACLSGVLAVIHRADGK